MRTSLGALSLAAVVGLARAQSQCESLTTLFPSCASSCINAAATTVGCTVATDLACQCSSMAAISSAALLCVAGSCQGTDLNSAINAAPSICSCVASAATATTTSPAQATTTTTPSSPVSTPSQPAQTTTTSAVTSKPVTTPPPACDTTSPCQASANAVPGCASSCISSAAVTSASCGASDYECQCASATLIQNAAENCVINACGVPTALEVISSVSSLCTCVAASPTTPCPTSTPGSSQTTPTTSASQPGSSSGSGSGSASGSASASGSPTTCAAATTADCGPVASSAVPQCAQACFSKAAPSVGCGATDYACQCEPAAQSSLSALLLPCVETACPPSQLTNVIAGASSVCACANAPTSGGSCATTSGSAVPTTTSGSSPASTTGSGSASGSSSCAPATTANCGPVATSAVPQCAQACFNKAAPSVGCGATDYACQCKPDAQSSLSLLLLPCVETACPPSQLTNVIAGASSVCACANAAPVGGSCPTGTGSGSAPSGSVYSTPGGSGSGPSGSAYSTPGGSGSVYPTSAVSSPYGGGGGSGPPGYMSSGYPNGTAPGTTCEVVTLANCESVSTTTTCYPTGGASPSSPASTPPGVVVAAGAHYEIGLVAGVFGAVWLAAVAL